MSLNIHQSIKEKLEYFHSNHKIPNILFHGASGSGKRTIVHNFINLIYDNNKHKIKDFVMYVNCAHGKGIKFIRDDLKFFAKTHINSNGGDIFKSIIMLNADKLTIDAQSALRRCIELFSHNTRFFIIVEDKYKLLKPVLSRFCEIYIPDPVHLGRQINLHKYNIDQLFKKNAQTTDWLKKTILADTQPNCDPVDSATTDKLSIILRDLSAKIYEKGYSALDIMALIEQPTFLPDLDLVKRYELLFAFNKIKKEFRNEKLLIMFVLNFVFISSNVSLENISFM
jgi:GTPase SAR1 family protein